MHGAKRIYAKQCEEDVWESTQVCSDMLGGSPGWDTSSSCDNLFEEENQDDLFEIGYVNGQTGELHTYAGPEGLDELRGEGRELRVYRCGCGSILIASEDEEVHCDCSHVHGQQDDGRIESHGSNLRTNALEQDSSLQETHTTVSDEGEQIGTWNNPILLNQPGSSDPPSQAVAQQEYPPYAGFQAASTLSALRAEQGKDDFDYEHDQSWD